MVMVSSTSFLLTASNSAPDPTVQPAITASDPVTPTGYPSDVKYDSGYGLFEGGAHKERNGGNLKWK